MDTLIEKGPLVVSFLAFACTAILAMIIPDEPARQRVASHLRWLGVVVIASGIWAWTR